MGVQQILVFIDYLAYGLGLQQSSVKQYVTNAKMFQLTSVDYLLHGEGPWRPSGQMHPLVAQALANIPTVDTTAGFAIPSTWLMEGFHEWPLHEYITLEIIFGWMG